MYFKYFFVILFYVFSISSISAQKNPARVFITAGQSNTDGRTPVSDLPDYIKSMSSDTTFASGEYTYCKLSQNRVDGKFIPFWPKGKRWAYDAVVFYKLEQYYKHDFYAIKWAVGGTSISPKNEQSRGGFWSADSAFLADNTSTSKKGRSLLLSFIEQIDNCIDQTLSKLPEGYKIEAFLWHQGESDSDFGKEYYKNINGMLTYVRSYLSEKTGQDYSKLPFVFGTVSQKNKRFNKEVETAMKKLADEDPDVYLIDMSQGELLSDKLHFTKTFAEYLGNEMYKILSKILNLNDYGFRVAKYKDDKTCAISYTFDDGLAEHYTLVAPAMEKLGFNGTFWVNGKSIEDSITAGGNPRVTWAQLKKMAKKGHEISNHGWAHKNFRRFPMDEIKRDIYMNDSAIYANVGIMPLSFAYPHNTKTSEGVKIASENRVGTRTEQFSMGRKSTHENLDKRIADLLENKTWGVVMIHGITYGYDHFSDADILWKHLGKVKALEDKIWVGTFQEVVSYAKEQKAITYDITKTNKGFRVIPSLSLDKKLFTEPLTAVVEQENVKKVTARQVNKKLKARILADKVIFDFDPFGGAIEVEIKK